jgi:transposase
VKLVCPTLEQRFVAAVPERLIGDKAYDSDPLDHEVRQQFGAEMIAPHRQGRRPDRRTQDGRPLRRFKRRWKIERLFAWLYNFRRLVVRYEYHSENYFGFIQLACIMILLRHLSYFVATSTFFGEWWSEPVEGVWASPGCGARQLRS